MLTPQMLVAEPVLPCITIFLEEYTKLYFLDSIGSELERMDFEFIKYP